jgi:hypothetical protein
MRNTLIAAVLVGLGSTASAHEVARGPNGGRLVDVSVGHLEMVARDTDLILFLTDEADQPLASAGAKNARAVVQDGGKSATVPLTPQEPNRLVGTLSQPMTKGARVVVSVTLPDGRPVQARFVHN